MKCAFLINASDVKSLLKGNSFIKDSSSNILLLSNDNSIMEEIKKLFGTDLNLDLKSVKDFIKEK